MDPKMRGVLIALTVIIIVFAVGLAGHYWL
jgi:hypothetical protein